MARHSYRMHQRAGELAELAEKLMRPEMTAAGNVTSIGVAVRREVETLNLRIEDTAKRLRTMEEGLSRNLSAIDAATRATEERTVAVQTMMKDRARLDR